MARGRVFVIWINPLFRESTRLLLEHPDVEWVGAATDISMAHEEILKHRPDTVLFEKTRSGVPADIIEMLGVETWDLRIIGISLEDNELILYHRENQMVVKAGDLLQFVLG
jgi:DNA-binding NarL/FixJ family response regulator